MHALVKGCLAAALLCTLVAPPARAQLVSRPVGDDAGPAPARSDRRGIYLGLFADVGVQLATAQDAKLGYGGEARLGYSFSRTLQLYLAGAVTNATYETVAGNYSQQFIIATVHLHSFAFLDRSGVGVYYDGGIGIAFASPGFSPTGSTDVGLGFSGAIGVEIPLSKKVSLAPEFVYRGMVGASTTVDGTPYSGNINFIGLQVGILYY
jgi:hypothetical protein